MKRNKSLRLGKSMLISMLVCIMLAACGGGGTSGTKAGSNCG